MNAPVDISTCWQIGDWVLNGEQNTISRASVSYTHLTLPTIRLV